MTETETILIFYACNACSEQSSARQIFEKTRREPNSVFHKCSGK